MAGEWAARKENPAMENAKHRDFAHLLKYPQRQWAAILHDREEQVFLVLTLVIGALTGLAVVAFILVTERFGLRLYPVVSASWRRLLIPVLGSFAMGILLFRYFPEARGSGVPQTKAALFVNEGRISLRTVLGKFFCTSATLASGIPLGREGPSVQVGAGIASILGRRLGLGPDKVKALIPVGAAAAIAAAFNTPLAAVLFALEEVMSDLHAPVLGSVVLASATSWMVLRLVLGNTPLFEVPQYRLIHPWEFGVYAVLGVAGGLVSVAFTRFLLWIRGWFLKLPHKTVWFQPLAGGLVVGLMGWFVPQVLGVGYTFVGDALNGRMAVELMALLVVLKFVAVTTSYASGNAGGLFGPSLFIGAMLGGSVGWFAHHLLPAYTATPGVYALVGMGTLFAGIVRAPMTSVLMIFETTRDYMVIVPLMISNLISFYISKRLQPQPIYAALAFQDGIHLPSSETRHQDARYTVKQAMRPAQEVLSAQMTLAEAYQKARSSKFRTWPVVDSRGVVGVVNALFLERAVGAEPGDQRLEQLLEGCSFPHVHLDHSLYWALERMGAAKLDLLPVVSRDNVNHMEGIVTLAGVLHAYGVSPEDLNHGNEVDPGTDWNGLG
jgi:CIC family chloride channel protein